MKHNNAYIEFIKQLKSHNKKDGYNSNLLNNINEIKDEA